MRPEAIPSRVRDIVCWTTFLILLVTYWLTIPESVSYWDCPEYVSAAYLLEIGHPPGNPLWMLVERVVSMLAPSPRYVALVINMSSGIFTALAGYLLAASVFPVTLWLLRRRRVNNIRATVAAAGVSMISALTFGWSDSAWYSAVEAEVYAMSIFFTALTVWLMMRWAFMHDRLMANRYLVLLSYIFGLSLGVHQLNLLVIPALALVWGLRRGIRNPWKLLVIIVLGMLAVGCVLVGMMPGSIALAADFELFAVNDWGLPPLSGVVIYLAVLGLSLILALVVTSRSENRGMVAAAIFPAIFMSSIFAVNGHFMVSAAVSAVMSMVLVQPQWFDVRRLNLSLWMLTMLLAGYGVYALVPIRGSIPSPANPSLPGEPFAFATYQAREQYGGNPLLYGATPFSRPMFQEEWHPGDSVPVYRRYALKQGHPVIVPYSKGERYNPSAGRLVHQDSLYNDGVIKSRNQGYIVRGYRNSNIYTPELNMWFPRLTSHDEMDISSYYDWAGMEKGSMRKVPVSVAFDSMGHPVPRMIAVDRRDTTYSYKPTVAQNIRFLTNYQIGYMYFRYLMWNFCGRQNDRPSQGAVQYGNFITGVPVVDNAMLGAEEHLPPEEGRDNPGRNIYYGIPFILGILGLVWMIRQGKRGRAAAVATFLLFFMTGVAIVIYLNQGPGEPRERDYSFLGSFWIFSAWVGYGTLCVAQWTRSQWTLLLMLGVPVWMCVQNFDDHDRTGRHAASSIASSVLESMEQDAILFVNGDNYTFPLWYAQEVEGIRPDVRIINTSYLGMNRYASELLGAWRDAPALPTTLRREDLVHGAFNIVTLPAQVSDTLPAVEIMSKLRQRETPVLEARYALLPVSESDTIVYDMRLLTSSGKGTVIMLPQLVTFDIVATNAAQGFPRSIHWERHLGELDRMRLGDDSKTYALFTERFGSKKDGKQFDRLAENVTKVRMPNDLSRDPYLDATPAQMVGMVRTALIQAARRQLDAGRLADAVASLSKADLFLGEHPRSYPKYMDNGLVKDAREELGSLQLELAARLETSSADIPNRKSRIMELTVRGRYNRAAAAERKRDWLRYRESLPPRLRSAMAPV